MPDDPSGTYSLPEAPFAASTVAQSARVNSNFSDIATALTDRVTRDGSGSMSGNLAMGSNRITGLSVGAARTDAAALAQVQDGGALWGGTAGGTADARTITLSPAITAYAAGQRFAFVNGAAANTGAATLNINGVGALAVRKGDGSVALAAGDLPASALVTVQHDGTVFRLISATYTAAQAVAAIGGMPLSGGTFTGLVGFGDTSFYANLAAGVAGIGFDSTDLLTYTRATNTLALDIGGSTVFSINATAANFATQPTVAGAPITAVLQTLSAEYTTSANLSGAAAEIPYDDTTPTSSEGTQVASVTITPSSTTTRLEVDFIGWGTTDLGTVAATVTLFAGSTLLAASSTLGGGTMSARRIYVPGSTSPVTITARVGPSVGGALRMNGDQAAGQRRFGANNSRSVLTVRELIP